MEGIIITGPRWNNPEAHEIPPLRCTICEACRTATAGPHRSPTGRSGATPEQQPQGQLGDIYSNPKLCRFCQDWDDIAHVVFCLRDRYARIDPETFSVGGPDIPGHLDHHAEYDQTITDLKFYPPERWSPKSCILCRCIGGILQDQKENGSQIKMAAWRPFAFSDFPWLGIQAEDRLTIQQSLTQRCLLPICISASSVTNQIATYKTLFLELAFHYEHYGYGLVQVSRWDRRLIDVNSITRWLTYCKDNHGDLCNKPLMSMSPPREFRLINTSSRRIVECRTPVQYAALSYTWALATGSPNKQVQLKRQTLEELSKENALTASRLPEVIPDAIQLCVDVGQEYLWVDRLCIIQDDDASKHDQIAAMGTIYHMAAFTIVALANGVGDGLPGVSCRPREPTLDNRSWRLIATHGGRYSFAALSPGLPYETKSST